jgi:hypothetical protein
MRVQGTGIRRDGCFQGNIGCLHVPVEGFLYNCPDLVSQHQREDRHEGGRSDQDRNGIEILLLSSCNQ